MDRRDASKSPFEVHRAMSNFRLMIKLTTARHVATYY